MQKGRCLMDEVTILESREAGRGVYEICATATALYDEEERELVLDLDSFVRRVIHAGKDEMLHPSWLPKKDSIRTHLDLDEVPEAAREVTQGWWGKVRKNIPPSSEWNAAAPWLQSPEGSSNTKEIAHR